jgi:transcriptional regulator with XRE-family HTH domain
VLKYAKKHILTQMITVNDPKYAQRLRGLRLNKGLKQELVAKTIGISSQQEYSKLENGKIHFSDELIVKVCTAFNISPDEFINAGQGGSILQSPHSLNNSQNNSSINDSSIIEQLVRSKDETIHAQKELLATKDMVIASLQAQVALLSGNK